MKKITEEKEFDPFRKFLLIRRCGIPLMQFLSKFTRDVDNAQCQRLLRLSGSSTSIRDDDLKYLETIFIENEEEILLMVSERKSQIIEQVFIIYIFLINEVYACQELNSSIEDDSEEDVGFKIFMFLYFARSSVEGCNVSQSY